MKFGGPTSHGNRWLPKSRRGAVICYAPSGSLGEVLARMRFSRRLRAGSVLSALGIAAVSLAACGRAGPPEPPPGPIFGSYQPPPAASVGAAPPAPPGSREDLQEKQYEKAAKNGFDAYGNPIAPPSERKSFFLDFLLQ